MFKNKRYLNGAAILLCSLLLISCGVSDKGDEPPAEKQSLELEGTWRFKTLNFTDASLVTWDASIDYTTGNYFGYAPAMFEGMTSFDFQTAEVTDGSGKKFNFVDEGDRTEDDTKEYWYWNYTDNGQSFEIKQINPQLPPYDFSVMDITGVVSTDDGNKLSFEARLNTREVGGTIRDIRKVPVEITLERGDPGAPVEIYIEGELFEEPTVLTTTEKLVNTHWKLEPGSDLYSPGFDDMDNPDKAYLKIVALNLADDNTLFYRYAYPMGIVSAKEYVQELVDENKLVVQMGGSYGTPVTLITWQIESIDKAAGKMILKETESSDTRVFILTDDINTDADEADYNIVTE